MPSEIRLRGRAQAFYKSAPQGLRRELDRHLHSIMSNPYPDGQRVISDRRLDSGEFQYLYADGAWLIAFVVSIEPDGGIGIVARGILHKP